MKLRSRDIDRELHLAGPGGGLLEGLMYPPIAERRDQPDLFGDRDELVGWHHAALGMLPAQQRLEAADAVLIEVVERLVVQRELVLAHRLAEIELERAA